MTSYRYRFGVRGPVTAFAIFVLAIALQGAAIYSFEPWTVNDTPDGSWATSTDDLFSPSDQITRTFIVYNYLDNGEGTLRQAILDANASPGRDMIGFDITVTGTITLEKPLPPITGTVYITGANGQEAITIDAGQTLGDVIVISGTNVTGEEEGTTVQGLRLINVNGNAFVIFTDTHTLIDGNVIENVRGGVDIHGTATVTVTNNVIDGAVDHGIRSIASSNLIIARNAITVTTPVTTTLETDGIVLLDGVNDVAVISNTLSVGLGYGVRAAGQPAPTGVQVRDNVFAVANGSPIYHGPGVNNGFPAPQLGPTVAITETLTASVMSTAEPSLFEYPLLIDLYRIRDGTYVPVGPSVRYTAFPDFQTVFFTDTIELREGDLVAAIATTSNPSTSTFSVAQPVVTARVASIDIKPGSDPNSLNCENPMGVVPVAILGRPDFDALDVDHLTVYFGLAGSEATESHRMKSGEPKRHEEDVDGDGLIDLVFHFRLGDTGLGCGDEEGILSGETFDGFPFSGTDAVRMVPGSLSKRGDVPSELAISQNYPNPFSESTMIELLVPETTHLTVVVIDVVGREVARLMDREVFAGRHSLVWNADGLASGTYFYQLRTDDQVKSGQMVLLR